MPKHDDNDVRIWNEVAVVYLYILLHYLFLETGRAGRNLRMIARLQGFE
jgi:hypothetical protein